MPPDDDVALSFAGAVLAKSRTTCTRASRYLLLVLSTTAEAHAAVVDDVLEFRAVTVIETAEA
jgi:hypothetical protein